MGKTQPTLKEIERRDKLFNEKGIVVCNHCLQELSIEHFGKSKDKKYGISKTCKECSAILRKTNRENNKERFLENDRKYRERYKDKIKTVYPRVKHTLNHRYTLYKSGAKRRNIIFDLTKEEFDKITQQPCLYCGDFPNYDTGYSFVGVDRINSSKGYTSDNVVPCCEHCNQMKLDLSQKDWVNKLKQIINYMELSGHMSIIETDLNAPDNPNELQFNDGLFEELTYKIQKG